MGARCAVCVDSMEHPRAGCPNYMNTRQVGRRLMASSLVFFLFSCRATGYVPSGPSGASDLSRYVLVIQEGPDGQLAHSWKPLSGFDLSKYPCTRTTRATAGSRESLFEPRSTATARRSVMSAKERAEPA